MHLKEFLGAAALTLLITAASAAAMSEPDAATVASAPAAGTAPSETQTSAAVDAGIEPGG